MLHTQFARSMATKVLVAITWLLVGIGQCGYITSLLHPYIHFYLPYCVNVLRVWGGHFPVTVSRLGSLVRVQSMLTTNTGSMKYSKLYGSFICIKRTANNPISALLGVAKDDKFGCSTK